MKAVRVSPDEIGCVELVRFNAAFHVKHGYLPLSPTKALAAAYTTAAEGGAFLVTDESGQTVGSIGLFVMQVYYSDAPILTNRWLNVLPGASESGAFRALLEAAKQEAVDRQVEWLLLTRSFHRSELRGAFGRVSESIGFQPFGHATRIRLRPPGGESDGQRSGT